MANQLFLGRRYLIMKFGFQLQVYFIYASFEVIFG